MIEVIFLTAFLTVCMSTLLVIRHLDTKIKTEKRISQLEEKLGINNNG